MGHEYRATDTIHRPEETIQPGETFEPKDSEIEAFSDALVEIEGNNDEFPDELEFTEKELREMDWNRIRRLYSGHPEISNYDGKDELIEQIFLAYEGEYEPNESEDEEETEE